MKHLRKKRYFKDTLSRRSISLFLFSLISIAIIQAQINITGTVVDENNEPMIGITVTVKNTTVGSITDLDGKYSLAVPNSKSVLTFSFLGYQTQEIVVGNQKIVNVKLKEDSKQLDEVVVVGFQTQKKVNLTAAVSSIDSKAFENRPVSNVGQALIGVSPGLNVSIAGGDPNKVPDLNVRGATTIRDKKIVSSNPLILLDGIEISNEDLNQINPADIDNISVLKDASAAAIYGTRATYGVILVQSKSGSFNQKAKINYSYDISWDKPVKRPDILNSYTIYKSGLDRRLWTTGEQYTDEDKEMLEHMQAYINDPVNNKPWFMKGDIEGGTVKWVGNTNPYKELIRDWTPTQKHNFSINGGSDKVAYGISLGAQNQEGMYKIAHDDLTRYNIMANISAKLTSRFKVSAKLSHNIFDYKSPTKRGDGDLWGSVGKYYPEFNIYQPLLTGADDPIPNHPTENQASFLYAGGKTKSSRRTSIFSISPEFIIIPKELTLKADLSLTPITYKKEITNPRQERVNTSWNPNALETRWATENNGSIAKSTTDRYAVNIYANYNKTFLEKHNVSALLGFNQERNKYSNSTLNLVNMLTPDILNPSLVADPTKNTSSVSNYITTARAVFGRVTYDYMSRYLFEFDIRYDGSSKFPKSDRYQAFPTFSLGWRISEEKFMESTRNWLDNLKFRGSWGRLGSQPDDAYTYQSSFGLEDGYFLFDGTRYPAGIQSPSIPSPNLTWETATTVNFGIDVTALKGRFDASFDMYQRETKDILLPGGRDYSVILGDTPPSENGGVLRNRGWELQMKWRDQLACGISYSVGFNLSDYKAKITRDPSNPTKRLGQTYAGMVAGEIWGYETGGILQKEDFYTDENGKLVYPGAIFGTETLYPGYLWYHDLDGDGVISSGDNTADSPGDRRIIGNSTPRYRYSITANVQYKGFDLDVLFQGVGKRDYWIDGASAYWGNGAGSWKIYNSSWTPDRTNTKFPMYGSTLGGRTQTRYLLNASYFALRQVVLGYTIPRKIVEKAKLSKVRVHLSGYNLFSITDIPKYYDLEYIQDAYPAKRTVALGIQVGF
jgi:TonB-linked SusC/RagA family outer membrane protein